MVDVEQLFVKVEDRGSVLTNTLKFRSFGAKSEMYLKDRNCVSCVGGERCLL